MWRDLGLMGRLWRERPEMITLRSLHTDRNRQTQHEHRWSQTHTTTTVLSWLCCKFYLTSIEFNELVNVYFLEKNVVFIRPILWTGSGLACCKENPHKFKKDMQAPQKQVPPQVNFFHHTVPHSLKSRWVSSVTLQIRSGCSKPKPWLRSDLISLVYLPLTVVVAEFLILHLFPHGL